MEQKIIGREREMAELLRCMESDKVVKHYTKANSRLSDNNVYSLCQDRLDKISTFVTTFGVNKGTHLSIVDKEITMDELFT